MANSKQAVIRLLFLSLVLGIGILGVAQNVSAQSTKDTQAKEKDDNDDDENLSDQDRKSVKISLAEARAIALKRVAGKVIDEELEKEDGRLQYAFDIKDSEGKIFDVEIDAMTGEVLQAEEDDDDDGDGDGAP